MGIAVRPFHSAAMIMYHQSQKYMVRTNRFAIPVRFSGLFVSITTASHRYFVVIPNLSLNGLAR